MALRGFYSKQPAATVNQLAPHQASDLPQQSARTSHCRLRLVIHRHVHGSRVRVKGRNSGLQRVRVLQYAAPHADEADGLGVLGRRHICVQINIVKEEN